MDELLQKIEAFKSAGTAEQTAGDDALAALKAAADKLAADKASFDAQVKSLFDFLGTIVTP